MCLYFIHIYSHYCLYIHIYVYIFIKAAEQAKASPALVAKDPSTSSSKKEEDDLAKGIETFFLHCVNE